MWALSVAMAAEPVSAGVWVGDAIPVDPIHDVVGSPDGWLVLDHASGTSLLRAARFGPSGVPEGEPVGLALPTGWQRGLWDGTSYLVVGVPFTDYYELVASIVAVPVPPTGAFTPAPVEVATGLGWPGAFEGGCGAGPCTIVFEDSHWLADPLTQRVGFSASGATAPQSAIGPAESRTPIAALRDADATAVVLSDGSQALVWLADDPAVPIDEVALPGVGDPELARAADGTILVAWSHYASNGDSGAPPGQWSVQVQRVRRGEGVLD
ncbi:MAG: hypothetical protein ABMA64_05135, partial [Myxococcota bacterium]